MQYGIAFTPLVPTLVLWIALAAIVVISALLLLGRARGAAVRVTALALILLALANPSFTREDREPLSSVAAVVIDKSPSQNFGERNRETARAQEALVDSLKTIKGLEVRVVEAGQADGETDGTRLFGALSSALSDVPIDRVAGAFMITDGRVHDIPANAAGLGFQAPVHALITGRKDERDRRIAISAAPRFGIVGQVQTITYRLDDQGVSSDRAKIVVRRDGEVINERTVQSGQTVNVEIDIKHAGPNIVEIEASPLDNELTLVNNRAVVAIQGVLPIAYFDNIARYVRAGGAVLVSAGPDYASTTSIWRTPLDSVLPAEPVGVTEKPFYAHLSDAGKRHPVTRGLEGSASEPPHWSRFFRSVETRNTITPPVMTGADGKPLLLLSRYGEGRVALLLSDHIWLWARGYEGGGPHLDLLRRMSHWLMKQPDLDEEALRLQTQGHDLVVLRQTMADNVAPVTVTSPGGASRELTLSASDPGTWRAVFPANELGLWQATDGTLKALINVGPTNPKEFSEVTSTTEMLKPLAQATGGDARRVVDGSSIELPRIVPVRASGVFRGDGWMGVKIRDASVVRGVGVLPVFAGLIGLLLLLGAFAATWLREGR